MSTIRRVPHKVPTVRLIAMQERQGLRTHHMAVLWAMSLGNGSSEHTLTPSSREAQLIRAQDRLEHSFTMTGIRFTTNRSASIAAYMLKPPGT